MRNVKNFNQFKLNENEKTDEQILDFGKNFNYEQNEFGKNKKNNL